MQDIMLFPINLDRYRPNTCSQPSVMAGDHLPSYMDLFGNSQDIKNM